MNTCNKESCQSSGDSSSGGIPSGSSGSIISRYNFNNSSPILFQLIHRQKWRKLRRLIKGRSGKKLCKECDGTGLFLLGIALGFHAPIDIIQLILQTDPEQILQKDLYGANPLHMACLNGASIETVKLLIESHGKELMINAFDNDNRTPLHQCVECICRNEIEYLEGCQVIYALFAAEGGTDMLHHQDAHGDTPLGIVQAALTHYDCMNVESSHLNHLYSNLLKYSGEIYKSKRRIWEAAGYCQKRHSARRTISAPILINRKDTSSRYTISTGSLSTAPSNEQREVG